MRNLFVLLLSTLVLTLPSVSSAMDVYGRVHPERYTFWLTPQGGAALGAVNTKMAGMLNTARPGSAQDALTVNNLQKQGYNAAGIAPFYPTERSQSTVRDDGKPVKVVTCLMSTVPNLDQKSTMDRTWCADEVGAEYIGFSGWPKRETVMKACKVGEDDCPVYLSLQGDDPTVRNDSVRFIPTKKPKVNTSRVDEVKANGCALANEAIRLETKQPGNCKAITSIETAGQGPSQVTAHFVTTTGESNILTVAFDSPYSRTVSVPRGGSFYIQLFKSGKWVCTGMNGTCY